MSMNVSWEFYGHNGEKTSPLTSKQIESLVGLDEYDLDGMEWEEEYLFGWGETSSCYAYDRIEEALTIFAALYPDVSVKAVAFYEADPIPGGFLVEHGKCTTFTGKITYYRDDNGEEVVI